MLATGWLATAGVALSHGGVSFLGSCAHLPEILVVEDPDILTLCKSTRLVVTFSILTAVDRECHTMIDLRVSSLIELCLGLSSRGV